MAKQHGTDRITICVLGASFDTGNLGVSALAESTIKILLHRWPEAQIVLLGTGHHPEEFTLPLMGREVRLRVLPIRFSKNLSLPYHFLWYVLYGVLARIVPGASRKRRIMAWNPSCCTLHDCSLAVDITGGDSFSDIYGTRRFILGFLRKWLILFYGKRLIMLPQTYGPFERRITRSLAKRVLTRAETIYSRDAEGIEYLRQILDGRVMERVRFSPDVAFVLDARRPPEWNLGELDRARTSESVLIGLNVSGLIYYGGYAGRDEFGFSASFYKSLVDEMVRHLLESNNALVVLVPHVIPADYSGHVDNDLSACLNVYGRLSKDYPSRLFLARGSYDHCQAKYIIGMCDLFIGTRMHSCIAALSQCIPAVGLAYSRKFRGVFQTAGVEQLVMDLRHTNAEDVMATIDEALKTRCTWVDHLRKTIPSIRQEVLCILKDVRS